MQSLTDEPSALLDPEGLKYLDSYENITLLGDFNIIPEDKNLQHFTDPFSLEHLINKPTCFKGSPSCIDLIINNRKS